MDVVITKSNDKGFVGLPIDVTVTPSDLKSISDAMEVLQRGNVRSVEFYPEFEPKFRSGFEVYFSPSKSTFIVYVYPDDGNKLNVYLRSWTNQSDDGDYCWAIADVTDQFVATLENI
jgi:hypothetical protein